MSDAVARSARASATLLACLAAAIALVHGGVVGVASASRAMPVGIVEHAVAADVAQHVVRPGLACEQPAAEGDAVGLVDDAVGIERVQVA